MPEEVLLLANHLSGVQSNPHTQHLITGLIAVRRQVALDRDSASQRVARAGECNHEPVALRFDLEATVRCQLAADDRVVAVQKLKPALVAVLLGEHRRAFDVREHDGDRSVGSGY